MDERTNSTCPECDPLTRREFLKSAGLAASAALAAAADEVAIAAGFVAIAKVAADSAAAKVVAVLAIAPRAKAAIAAVAKPNLQLARLRRHTDELRRCSRRSMVSAASL